MTLPKAAMSKIAIIDLGTNTFNLLIALVNKGSTDILYSGKQEVKLGKGGIDKNEIGQEAFQRGIHALQIHLNTIREHQCSLIKAFATSAIRSASNGVLFVETAQQQLGLEIEIISGLREAELIYKGVRQFTDLQMTSVIMDIGGGSTEFIIGNKKQIFWSRSYDLGVSRLLEVYKPSDPITPKQIIEIENHLSEQLVDLFDQCEKNIPGKLIGSSGSFETFAAMLSYPDEPKSGYLYNLEALAGLHSSLLTSTLAERLATPGMISMRADMIVLSSLLVQTVLRTTGIRVMEYSSAALKEGVLSEFLG